jgi:hypothetical protein
MKKFILAALMALPLSILAQQRASADGCACCFSTPPVGLTIGFRFKFSGGLLLKGPPQCGGCGIGCCSNCGPCGGCGGCGGGCAAPWYTYWPQDAHFQSPAPTGYPYWPSGMGAMMDGHCAAGYGAPPMAYGYGYGAPPMAYGYGYGAPPMAYGYENGAPPMVAGYNYGPPPPAMALPMGPTINYSTAPSVQPCSYSPSQVPSYWYGR